MRRRPDAAVRTTPAPAAAPASRHAGRLDQRRDRRQPADEGHREAHARALHGEDAASRSTTRCSTRARCAQVTTRDVGRRRPAVRRGDDRHVRGAPVRPATAASSTSRRRRRATARTSSTTSSRPCANGLSADGKLYAAPFYAESSFLMYRKDILKKAGVTMPDKPTWDEVAQIAAQGQHARHGRHLPARQAGLGRPRRVLHDGAQHLRRRPGGPRARTARSTRRRSTSRSSARRCQFYVDLVKDAGEKDAANASFNECLSQYRDGKVAMWYDATVAAGLLEADDSPVKGKNGYALAPINKTEASGWLWSWALAIPKTHEQAGPRVEVRLLGDRPGVHQGGRAEDRRRLGGDPAGHAQVDLRDPGVQEGGRRRSPTRRSRRWPRRRSTTPGTTQAPRPARGAVRRRPGVPGRRQPVHAAVLRGDRRQGVHRRRARATASRSPRRPGQ